MPEYIATLRALVALKRHDEASDAVQKRLAAIQDALDLHGVKIQALEERRRDAKKALEELVKNRRQLEIDVQTLENKLAKYQDQLFSVKSNQEYEALQHEIAQVKQQKAKAEEKVIEALLNEDEKKAHLKVLEEKEKEERLHLEEEKKTLEKERGELLQKQKDFEAQRKSFADRVPSDVLQGYETLRASGKRVALAALLEDGTCEGCRINVPPQLKVELNKGMQLQRCSCGRFLFDPAVLEE